MLNNFQQSNSIHIIQALHPEQLLISLSSEDIERAKPREQDYSNDWARHNALINRLTVNAIKPWLEDDTGEKVKIWEENTLHTFWEIVNGTALEINRKRIILIPSDNLDTEEYIVPTEWIKIPNWIGDYYLAIQVNLEDMWLRVWGCTTHKHICQIGEYDARWQNYCLAGEELVSDINVMLEARKFNAENKLAVDPLPVLDSAEINKMMSDLAQPSSFSPRHKIDFDKWGEFISEKNREQLYFQRCSQSYKIPTSARITNLQNWLKGRVEGTWQQISQVIYPTLQPEFGLLLDENSILGKSVALADFIQLDNSILGIYAQITSKEKDNSRLVLAVCPSIHSDFRQLPKDLRIALIDKNNDQVIQVINVIDRNSKKISIPNIESGNTLAIQLLLNNTQHTEIFEI